MANTPLSLIDRFKRLPPEAHKVGTWVTSFGTVGFGIILACMNGYGGKDKSVAENIGLPAAYAFMGTVGLQIAMQLFLASENRDNDCKECLCIMDRFGNKLIPLSDSLYNTVSSGVANAFLIACYFAAVQANLKWGGADESDLSNAFCATLGLTLGNVLLTLWSSKNSVQNGTFQDNTLKRTVPWFAATLTATLVAHVAPLDKAGFLFFMTSMIFGFVLDAVRYATNKWQTGPKLEWRTLSGLAEMGFGFILPKLDPYRHQGRIDFKEGSVDDDSDFLYGTFTPAP